MIVFQPESQILEPLEGKANETAAKSIMIWRVWYVPFIETKDHIDLGFVGLVPMNFLARTGYIWLYPKGFPSRKVLQESKIAFSFFLDQLPWTTYTYTEIGKMKNSRFAEFMGYRQIYTLDGYHFFERDTK